MKKFFLFSLVMFVSVLTGYAQVGINTNGGQPAPSAGLDVSFLDKGFLAPRMTTLQRNGIINPAEGLLVYCTDCGPTGIGSLSLYQLGTWKTISPDGTIQPWIVFQNSTHSVIGNNFYPITNSGMTNVFLGDSTGVHNTIGASNTFIGQSSGLFNNQGSDNISIGKNALRNNNNGVGNIAIGYRALEKNKDSTDGRGSHNLAIGVNALRNAVSESNVVIGHQGMEYLTTGMQNTGIGEHVMRNLNSGYYNTAIGYGSMYLCSATANGNVTVGVRAGEHIAGQGNVCIGYQAGHTNLGNHNVFIGSYSGDGTNWQNISNKLVVSSDISNIDNPLIYGEFDNKIVKISDVLQLAPRTSAPSNPVEGTLYVNSTTHHIFVYLNGVWKQLDN